MIKDLNNKGYLLVEIILASVLAMVIAYFMTDLTIKLKNKNDDLLVKTLVSTDQAIIYNTIMKDLYNDPNSFSCDNISVSGNKFTYNGFTNIVSEYAKVSYNPEDDCNVSDKIRVNIGLEVKQLPDDNFNIDINFNK